MAPTYIVVDPDAVMCGDVTGNLDCELDLYNRDKDTARLDRDFPELGVKIGGALAGVGLLALAGWQLYVNWDGVVSKCRQGADWIRGIGTSTGQYDFGCISSPCQKRDDLR